MAKTVRLATRSSPLALKQAELVKGYILEHIADCEVSYVEVSTSGDVNAEWSLEKQGGAGLFTAEVSRAVETGEADIGVHSAKDMPSADGKPASTISLGKGVFSTITASSAMHM